jgi:beta-glucosidase
VHYSARYLDLPTEPLFPFGYGLAYTRFTLGELTANPTELAPNGNIEIGLEVANDGAVMGEETLFLFIRDPVATVARPLLELKDVAKITLAPGERGRVAFRLAATELAYPGPDLTPRLDPGTIEILVGRSAAREDLVATSIRVTA